MLKTGFKAFIYSFSISLFAILTAHRTLLYTPSSEQKPLKIDHKNIVLFLKNAVPGKSPSKKISLNVLPDISSPIPSLPKNQEDIILADNFEDIDFPLEFEPAPTEAFQVADVAENEKTLKSETPIITADVLYAPDMPQKPIEIAAAPIYQPTQTDTPALTPPPAQKVVLAQAVASDNTTIPLQKSSSSAVPSNAKIGSTKDLDHIALVDNSLSIESMKKEPSATTESSAPQKKWVPLNNDPWVVAYSNAGAKNKLAAKGDASQAFIEKPSMQGVQIADETAKNIILPIPDKIMENSNLTPKLAYPRDSEDAEKEKLIDAKIQAETVQQEKGDTLLTTIDDEDVPLDAPKTDEVAKSQAPTEQPAKTDITKENFLGKINSIFSQLPQKTAEVKEKAIAKAQARRSLKKKLAKFRPVSILPTEIRLSFQPNRAEISGQTLRWVQAFASKTAESADTMLEIRIDGTTSPVLQQRRLNLLHNILVNKGVEYSKINTVFTSREPNSFILRTVTIRPNNEGEQQKINDPYTAPYRRW